MYYLMVLVYEGIRILYKLNRALYSVIILGYYDIMELCYVMRVIRVLY